MMTKKISISLLTLTFVSMLVFVVPQAHAQGTTNTTRPNFFQGIIDFISQKFGLDKTQVQSAVNDYRAQRKATMTPRPQLSAEDIANREKTRLDKLVTDGKITSAQEQAIITELAAIRSKYSLDSMKNLTSDQRRQKMQQMHDEIVTWAKSQGIDSSYVMPGFGMMGGMRKGMRPGFRGNWEKTPSVTPTVTPTQ